MLTYRYQKWYVTGVFFFYLSLIPQAYCTQAHGLKIDLVGHAQKKGPTGKSVPVTNLTQIAFPTHTSVIEEVPCTLLEASVEASDSSPEVDTDNEGEASLERKGNTVKDNKELNELAITKNTKPYRCNRSRNVPRSDEAAYEPRRNYLKTEFQLNKLRVQLSKDAFDIVSSESNSRTQDSTVCFCVALRDKRGYVKKFSFHNGANVMSPAMRAKAHELGYDVIQAEQSHAEGQFLQCLLHRHRKRPGLYTHIMGMGCSRCYCVECDHILKACLGGNYYAVTASVYDKKKDQRVGPKVDSISGTSVTSGLDEVDNSNDDVPCTQVRVQKIQYKIVKEIKAIDTASYDSMYLPEILQEFLRRITGINQEFLRRITGINYDFSDNRFTKSTKSKIRKRSGSAPKPVS